MRFGGFGRVGEQFGIVMFQHSATGAGRNDDRVILGKRLELLAGDLAGFLAEAGIVSGLAAAGLLLGINDLDAFAAK